MPADDPSLPSPVSLHPSLDRLLETIAASFVAAQRSMLALAAKGQRELEVAWTARLGDGEPYRVELARLLPAHLHVIDRLVLELECCVDAGRLRIAADGEPATDRRTAILTVCQAQTVEATLRVGAAIVARLELPK